jgi:hypothetical protein
VNTIKREEIRANLLKNQADAALAAAQPVVQLRAPFDAQVTDVGVALGQTLAPADSTGAGDITVTSGAATAAQGRTMAVRLASSDSSSVMAQASESDVTMLSVGQTVNLTFPGVAGQSASGKISEIGGAPTSTNDGKIAYPVRVDIPSLSPDVKLGMSAQVGITIGEAQDVLMAPRETVRTVNGQQLVSRIDGDKITDVVVQVGRTYGSQVELVDGVKEGDVLGVFLPTRSTS